MSFFFSEEFPKVQGRASIALVRAEFNSTLTSALRDDTIWGLKKCGIQASSIEEFVVPGAFEIPFAVKKLQDSGDFDGVIALGVIIRGETPHFDIISIECARGVMQCSLQSDVPVVFGVLTTEDEVQAEERLKKGRTFASALAKMMVFARRI
jgi:6,7-dimethyl-8-ribityllumazine synthase